MSTKQPKHQTHTYKILITAMGERVRQMEKGIGKLLSGMAEDPEGIRKISVYRDNESVNLDPEDL